MLQFNECFKKEKSLFLRNFFIRFSNKDSQKVEA